MKTVLKELESIFGDRLYTEPQILALYSREASSESGRLPLAVVYPANPDEVVELVKTAIKNRLKIVPLASSTSLSGNTVTKEEGVVAVSFEKMVKVLEISDVDWYARVQPGIRVDELNLELSKYGLQWPVDPASARAASVGGVIANGGGGVKGARYGPASHWVLALEAVIGTGDVIRVGCSTVKCREGYNLMQLFIGSEGTLGIVTEATLRLAPLPQSFVGVMSRFQDVMPLVDAVIEVRRSRIWPTVAEFVDREVAKLVGLGEGYYLWLGCEVTPGGEKNMLNALSNVLSSRGEIIAVASSLGEFNKLLEPRRRLYSAQLNAAFEDYGTDAFLYIEDIAVPISKLGEAVKAIETLARKYRIKYAMGGHIGDGNLHPAAWARRSDEEEMSRVRQFYLEVGRLAIKLGGTISAEHGIGTHKKALLREAATAKGSDVVLKLMKELKRVFDPYGVFNPGKIVD
ncbi:FAD-binding oxidoreductase [Pyrobaculum calidifontis]|uniref:D-lactate dehydrogenase (cytochrome) n=1 Tax=Pyrobaculum calidifontis (strain DSM 21063 / JCM 11548 / VA1) TaxID=410359 RepID=A3MVH6_PYRCJ|nr:FAD-linked oxidase C-terminal domain-containing protein [Pyrobaculum calidifontis]ABO08643.1 D-lactate dehydrogenase (cytochrome) [Pyrobaculum calidifontis JCM 11548]